MKSERYDGQEVRQILIGMITDQTVCSRIATKWDGTGLFSQPWANLVGSWCVKYLDKYNEPPNGNIETIFQRWAAKDRDEKVVELIDKFLSILSDEYDAEQSLNSDFLLDLATKHFDKVRIKQSIELAQDDLFRNDLDSAYSQLVGLDRIELGSGSLCKVAEDEQAWEQAFDTEGNKAMVKYPGALGKMLGNIFHREGFVSFMGMDKAGKSFFLLDLAVRALKARNRVVYVDTGDMTRSDNLRRFGCRVARRPLLSGELKIPREIRRGKEVDVKHESINFEGLPKQAALDAVRKLVRGKDVFRLLCFPNSTVSVGTIQQILLQYIREDWLPDVLVIDYADILAPPQGIKDTLDQIDVSWKQMRQLSQELHCLVVTATQTSARAYASNQAGKLVKRQHFGGRKTKLAHVTGMIGINMFPGDDEKGLRRLNVVVGRNEHYGENSNVKVAGCLDIASPVIISSF